MFEVYVLYSRTYNKIYIGYSSDLPSRLYAHNIAAKKGYTVRFRPWVVVYRESTATKSEALQREKELKSAKGRQFIWSIIKTNHA